MAGKKVVPLFKAAHGDERGQILVLFVFAFAVLLALLAIVVDAGNLYIQKTGMQEAADASALAAAHNLPGSPNAAVADARRWAEKNGYTDGVEDTELTVNTPYSGDSRSIEVVIERSVPTFFARLFGMETVKLGARAVARSEPGSDAYVVFAHDDHCLRGVHWAGSSINVQGNIHSNGDLFMVGSRIAVDGEATYRCRAHVSRWRSFFAQGPSKVAEREWPVFYTTDDFDSCTFSTRGNLHITAHTREYWKNDDPRTGELKPGLYCADGNIRVSASAVTAEATFVAKGRVSMSASTFNLTPYENNIVIFSDSRAHNAVTVSGSQLNWQGLVFASQGGIMLFGSEFRSLSGGLYGEWITLAGSKFDLGAPPGAGGVRTRLIE